MRLCTFDAEAYYDPGYSLAKLTIEEYVRAPLFEMIGFSYKIDDAPAVWVHGAEAERTIRELPWHEFMVLGQNTMFDGAILSWRYGVKPAAWMDIMAISRALHPHDKSHSLAAQLERTGLGVKGDEVLNAKGKRLADFTPEELRRYGEYCCNDTERTYDLFQHYLRAGFPQKELRLIDLTLRMFIEPKLQLNAQKLHEHYAAVVEAKRQTLETVLDALLRSAPPDLVQVVYASGFEGLKSLLMSNARFAEALELFGVTPPMKKSPTTGKMTYAFAKTDEEFKALEEHPDPAVQALVAARLSNKTTLEETRTSRFIGMAARGPFPVPLRYYGAHSGRWAGEQSVNLQNLPSRGPLAGRIKKAIEAPPGYVVVDCDSSQIEARTLAWLAGQEDLVEAFRRREDVYKIMASKIYGIPVDEIDAAQRQVGKAVVLGCGYGVGWAKLQGFLKAQAGVVVDEAEARRIIDTYRFSVPHIVQMWRRSDDALRSLINGQGSQLDVRGLIRAVPGKGLTLPSGLFIQYPGLRVREDPETGKSEMVYFSKGKPVRIYGGKCLAADTEVLTERGWVAITDVTLADRVWDGEEWVRHTGVAYQGVKATIVLNGVRMTSDHQVLTSKGWVDASSCQGLHGADFRMPDGGQVCGGDAPFHVGVSVHMRQPELVYDLTNAGPRSRFAVRGDAGPFIVHNCVENFTQAVARCIVAEQMLRVSRYYPPVLTVHDAVAIVAPESEAAAAQACLEECMRWTPKWAEGLPLACESGVGKSYGDC